MSQDVEAQVRKQAELDYEIESEIARHRLRFRFVAIASVCVVLAVVVLAAWAVFKRVSVPELNTDNFFQQAVALEREGATQRSVNLLKKVLVAQPEHGEARWLLGRIYLSVGDGRAAEKEIRQARRLGRKDREVQYAILESMLLQRRYTELLIESVGFSDETDLDHRSEMFLAEAQFGLRRYVKASETVHEVLAADDTLANAHRVLTRLELAAGNAVAARDAIDQAERVDPDNVETRLLLARVALEEGRYPESRELFDAALSVQKNHPEGLFGKAQSYLAEGRPNRALQQIRQIESDQSLVTEYLSAVAHLQKGDIQTTRTGLRKLLNRFPDHLDALMLMAQVYYVQQEYLQAETGLSQLLNIAPNDVGALKLLATVHLDSGQIDKAMSILERAIGESPKDVGLLGLQARAFLAADDEEMAEEILEGASALAAEAGVTVNDDDFSTTQWRLLRCGLMVHFCQYCLYVRECI